MASFDENGKYIKTNWKAGDKITATKLNKIEESIEAVNDNDISRHVEADARLDALEAKDVAHDKELTNIKNTIADNKAAAELGDYDINSRMTFLENELNEGIEEVNNVAETVDGKIATAEANMTAQVNTAKDEMTAQVNQGKADMEAMVAEVEADLEGLHAKDNELVNKLQNNKKINALDLGVKNDGTETSSELQNAINTAAANKCPLYLPAGRYLIGSSLYLPSYSIIIGDGKHRTTIITNSNIDMLVLNTSINTTEGAYGIELKNFGIAGQNIASTGAYLYYTRETALNEILVSGCVTGVKLEQSWSNSFISSRIESNTTNMLLGEQSNDINFIDVCFDNAIEDGLVVTGDSQVININGCVFQNCGGNAILLDAGRSVNIYSCYFEKNNSSQSQDKYIINIRGQYMAPEGVILIGNGFWCTYESAAIGIDKCLGVTCVGGYMMAMNTETPGNAISVTDNSYYVSEYNVYKETMSNVDPSLKIVNPMIPTFTSNVTVKRNYPNLILDTNTKYQDPAIVFKNEGVESTRFTTYGDDFYMYSTSSSTSTSEQILKLRANNSGIEIYKNLVLKNCAIAASSYVATSNLRLTACAANEAVANSLFIDSSDNTLKFKDSSGAIKKVNLG